MCVCVFMCELKTAKTQLIQPLRGNQTRNERSFLRCYGNAGFRKSAVKPKNTAAAEMQVILETVYTCTSKKKKRGENTLWSTTEPLK